MGPDGGKGGGSIIAEGTPEKIIKKSIEKSDTARYLLEEINRNKIMNKN
jgi:excinuclease ABC subunit A